MQPFCDTEIKKVDNNHEQRVQEQIDSLMPWINEDIDDGLDLEQVEKYRPVGILNVCRVTTGEVNVVFKGNDGKLYCGFIDERDEENIKFIYDEFRLVSEVDKNRVVYFENLFGKQEELKDAYSIGDIVISAYQLTDDEIYVGRIDKYVEFLKEYREKLKLSTIELVKEIEEDIEYYGVAQKYSKLKESCERYPKIQLVPNDRAYQVIQEQIKDCRTCQNMSCRVENSEKPVEDCFGYINHEKKEQGPVKKLVPNNKK